MSKPLLLNFDCGDLPRGSIGSIARLPDGSFVLADSYMHRLLHCNSGGTLQATCGRPGRDQEGMHYPRALCPGAGGVYFADSWNGRIRHWDLGSKITQIYPQTAASQPLCEPTGIAQPEPNVLVVTEKNGHRITRIDLRTGGSKSNGRRFTTAEYQAWSDRWTHVGRAARRQDRFAPYFDYPTGLACGDDGQLMVLDSGNGRVSILSAQYSAVGEFSGPVLRWPEQIARGGDIFAVLSRLERQVFCYDRLGKYLGALDCQLVDSPARPAAIWLDDRYLYVTYEGFFQAQIFPLAGVLSALQPQKSDPGQVEKRVPIADLISGCKVHAVDKFVARWNYGEQVLQGGGQNYRLFAQFLLAQDQYNQAVVAIRWAIFGGPEPSSEEGHLAIDQQLADLAELYVQRRKANKELLPLLNGEHVAIRAGLEFQIEALSWQIDKAKLQLGGTGPG